MEYDSAIKRNVILTHAKTWRNLGNVMLKERNQIEKAAYFMITFI